MRREQTKLTPDEMDKKGQEMMNEHETKMSGVASGEVNLLRSGLNEDERDQAVALKKGITLREVKQGFTDAEAEAVRAYYEGASTEHPDPLISGRVQKHEALQDGVFPLSVEYQMNHALERKMPFSLEEQIALREYIEGITKFLRQMQDEGLGDSINSNDLHHLDQDNIDRILDSSEELRQLYGKLGTTGIHIAKFAIQNIFGLMEGIVDTEINADQWIRNIIESRSK